MSRPVIRRTGLARLDLVDAALFIADDNPTAALHFLDSVEQTLKRLARHPLLGRARDDLSPNLRSLPHRNFVIFYQPIGNGIELVRFLHSSRDVLPLLREDE